MKYSIDDIKLIIGAEKYGIDKTYINFLLTDSRSLCFPEETLFFALKSNRNDGNKYIPELYKRGVRNFVVEKLPPNYSKEFYNAVFLKVKNPLLALQKLTANHREKFNIPIVGITGSNGKTMVKEWLFQILSTKMNVTRSPKSYNSQIGVPLSVWLINKQSQIGLIEAGISQKGEMESLQRIIKPTIGIITYIGSAHQENFSSLEEKCNEKIKLFINSKKLIYQGDDQLITKCIKDSGYSGEKLYWSTDDTNAPFYIEHISKNKEKTTISYKWKQSIKGKFTIPFIDQASINDSIIVSLLALELNFKPKELSESMKKLEPIAMRLEVKEGRNGCTLINDSYNSDINSLDIALDFMNRRQNIDCLKKTLILSDIFQSGLSKSTLYRKVSSLVKRRKINKFIGIGKDIANYSKTFNVIKENYFFEDIKTFIESNVFKNLKNEIILIKGARIFCFDKITDLLVNKVHETVLEVNLNAIVDNLNWYRKYLKPTTKLVCMIKANAYGIGAIEVAKTLEEHHVDYLAVAVADEGATLRQNGITSNIMIMNPEMSSFKTLFDYDLEPEVYSFKLLDALIKAAEKEGITSYPIHIKLDTGMHRLGFDPKKDIQKLILRLKNQTSLIPRSIFSHFVGSDNDAFDDFSTKQFELFDQGSKEIQAAFDFNILRHIDNSAGIQHFPNRQLDMCRLGLGLYGINPRNNAIINNVATLKTTILQIHNVPADETVGYSRSGKLYRDSKIAAIPIGYADGLNRRLGNRKAFCLVNGQKAEYVGNICMDVAMIDVTDIDCKEGDTVEIFGNNLPVTYLSKAIETIPYEILTTISNRVKRVYYQD